jgi:hypothetical protein
MSTSSRRKAKKRVTTFTLVVEAQEMIVTYQPNWMPDTGHFEFRSPHEPARRIPVSETGYRSHFASMEDVEAASSPQDYAREVVLEILQSSRKPAREESNQLPLF